VFVVAASAVAAQPASRRATNLAALLSFPGFYHGRPILVVGKVALEQDGTLKVSDNTGSIHLVFKGNAPDGLDEIRGEFWDIGRMKPDEPKLTQYDLRATFHFDPEGAWPRPGEVTAIMATAVVPAARYRSLCDTARIWPNSSGNEGCGCTRVSPASKNTAR
jgi:hypothetical protein